VGQPQLLSIVPFQYDEYGSTDHKLDRKDEKPYHEAFETSCHLCESLEKLRNHNTDNPYDENNQAGYGRILPGFGKEHPKHEYNTRFLPSPRENTLSLILVDIPHIPRTIKKTASMILKIKSELTLCPNFAMCDTPFSNSFFP
jgi:hypothetical protein